MSNNDDSAKNNFKDIGKNNDSNINNNDKTIKQ